ncbi:uncharacterized protein J3D65DRAFT_94636 [Phyllosticta citribraziliensis]|uniref:Uncharacterized protein n=1 Tax=Phyllosticta citribraziliensis TaxID=989973 RepID=A0ABR1LA69_9PEZI
MAFGGNHYFLPLECLLALSNIHLPASFPSRQVFFNTKTSRKLHARHDHVEQNRVQLPLAAQQDGAVREARPRHLPPRAALRAPHRRRTRLSVRDARHAGRRTASHRQGHRRRHLQRDQQRRQESGRVLLPPGAEWPLGISEGGHGGYCCGGEGDGLMGGRLFELGLGATRRCVLANWARDFGWNFGLAGCRHKQRAGYICVTDSR